MPRLDFAALLIATALACPVTAAADSASCDGHWQGHFMDPIKHKEAMVDLTITGSSGSWITQLNVGQKWKNAACRGVSFPVKINQCTESELNFFVNGASVIRGCPRFKVELSRHGADLAKGVRGGRHETLEMTRQP